MVNPFEQGQWVQWSTPNKIKRGEVIVSLGPSIVVRWLDGEDQVFPVIEGYLGSNAEHRIEVIPRPPEAKRIERAAAKGSMTVPRAASVLGTTPKRVRAMLRSGELTGEQVDGKWVSVNV